MLRAPFLAALALIVGSSFLVPQAARATRPLTQRGTVTAILDPRTLDVRLTDGTAEVVQLFGLMAPAPGSCALGQATADAATLALGKPVWLVAVPGGPSRNRRRPVPAYVILPGGPDLGLALVKRGDATVRADQQSFKQRAAYEEAQRAAQASSLGLWGCPVAPQATTTGPPPGHGKGQRPSGHDRTSQRGAAQDGSVQPGSGRGSAAR